jgi:hypothetical protein
MITSISRVIVFVLVVHLATIQILYSKFLLNGVENDAVVTEHDSTKLVNNPPQPHQANKTFASEKQKRIHNIKNHPSLQTVKIFNSWDRERYFCGTAIAPNSTETIEVGGPDCPWENAFSHVFPREPSIHGTGVPSIMIHFLDKRNKNSPHDVECDVPCAVWPTGNPTVRDPAKIDDTPFQFNAYSMEGSGIYKTLALDPKAHQRYRYFATTSFQSEVPLSYYSESMYNIQKPSVNFDSSIKGASFLARNCNSVSGREGLLREMMNEAASTTDLRIESLSTCMRNALPPDGIDLKNKTEVMGAYLFHLSFENQRTPDYITEKLWGAFDSGTLPIYMGAPNIKEHVPPNSIVVVDDFSSTKELIAYMDKLSKNKTLYNTYHEWRKHPLPKSFQDKYAFTQTHSYCRVCRFSYAMKYGYGWDQAHQEIRTARLPRGETCLDDNGWMVGPIKETWSLSGKSSGQLDKTGDEKTPELCGVTKKVTMILPGSSVTRTIWDHDLVTDLEITGTPNSAAEHLIWTLEMPINTTQAIRRTEKTKNEMTNQSNVYWIQDEQSRIVIVFNETVAVSETLAHPGTLKIPITNPLRVRFIFEDIDLFHEDGAQLQSYFSSFMIDEFHRPLQHLG